MGIFGTEEEWLEKQEKKLTKSENNKKGTEPSEKIHKENNPKTFMNNNYFIWFLMCCGYSIFKLFKDSGGDIGRYFRPFEEFSIHLFVIMFMGIIPSIIYKIFSKKEFGTILIWITLIMGTMSLIGGYVV